MNCIECKAVNPDDNGYCGKCGAELPTDLRGTVQKKDFRNRQVVEMEITESVVERLTRWARWLAWGTAIPIAVFALMLGWSYHEVRATTDTARAQIKTEV